MGQIGARTVQPITLEQRRQQFELEQRVAREILASSPSERAHVTQLAYDRLYRGAPWHPDLQVTRAARAARARRQATLLTRHMRTAHRVLELGCGSGELLKHLARQWPNTQFVGIDISAEKLNSGSGDQHTNLTFRTGDCIEPDEPAGHYDLVISSQVLEHLHPDDVPPHLRAVRRLLGGQGVFELDTPHRYTGPHDVSAYFSRVACGTHLKEWTFGELRAALSTAGFAHIATDIPLVAHLRRVTPLPGDALLMPVGVKVTLEATLHAMPRSALQQTIFHLARMDTIVLYACAGGIPV